MMLKSCGSCGKKKPSGFTLIELLVVIAIIAILAIIILVALNSARARARYASGQSTLKSSQTAAVICMDEESNLNPVVGQAVVGTDICDANTDSDWEALPAGWSAITVDDGTVADGSEFQFHADFSAGGISHTFTCGANSCTE